MDPGNTPRLRVTVTDDRGRAVRAPGLAAWLAAVAPVRARGDVAVALVSDARMRVLNKQYRRTDKATDVLSFPSDSPAVPRTSRIASRSARLAPRLLGDIVVAEGVARRQAREAGHAYAVELKILALHGLLHLLGYDHHDPADGGRMARLERRLRAKGGLRTGLIERASQAPAARAGVARREHRS